MQTPSSTPTARGKDFFICLFTADITPIEPAVWLDNDAASLNHSADFQL